MHLDSRIRRIVSRRFPRRANSWRPWTRSDAVRPRSVDRSGGAWPQCLTPAGWPRRARPDAAAVGADVRHRPGPAGDDTFAGEAGEPGRCARTGREGSHRIRAIISGCPPCRFSVIAPPLLRMASTPALAPQARPTARPNAACVAMLEWSQAACTPSSVSFRKRTGRKRKDGGHLSRPVVASGLEQPTRGRSRALLSDESEVSSYLALLRVGFTQRSHY